MNPNCIFCRIITGVSPSRTIYQDNLATAFHDIHPAAPHHIIIVPNKHIESINSVEPEDESVLGHLFTVARQIATQEKIEQSGYRLIINTGHYGGQSVYHLHMHLLGGKRMPIPMV
jgi:histidine triad (HIT) family protein